MIAKLDYTAQEINDKLAQVGDFDAALDALLETQENILSIQNQLIGGQS